MKTRRTVGLILIICGAVMLSTTIFVHYYVSDVLLAPTEPPIMKPIEGVDRFLVSSRSTLVYLGLIGTIIVPVGALILLLSWRKRK